MNHKSLIAYGAAAALAAAAVMLDSRSASAQTAPCYAAFQGRLMYMINGPFDSCARTIRAAGGQGTWGDYAVNVDTNNNAYINIGNGQWQYVGVVPRANRASGGSGSGYNLEGQTTRYYYERQVPIQPRFPSPSRY